MAAEKQIIGDNFESGGGAMNIAKDHGTATQANCTLSSSGSGEELLELLDTARKELAALPVDEELKGDVSYCRTNWKGLSGRPKSRSRIRKKSLLNSKTPPLLWKKARKPSKAR